MARNPWEWEREDLDSLIGQAESIRLEFKQSKLFDDNREQIAENLSREVSAFANTEGGTIVIGIVEKREGKSRIASDLDNGVESDSWSREQIQQIVETNVSPFLTGIRIRSITLDADRRRFACVIHVPQGTTAYQAWDKKYYGRSEYESKALPDHEIRLLMFRGKTPSAIVRVTNPIEEQLAVTPKTAHEWLSRQSQQLASQLPPQDSDDQVLLKRYSFGIAVENTGEINITEFKVRTQFLEPNRFGLGAEEHTHKDGWQDVSSAYIALSERDRPGRLMRINVFPRDTFHVSGYEFFLPPGEDLVSEELILNWTLYLPNSLPLSGRIDVTSVFQTATQSDEADTSVHQ